MHRSNPTITGTIMIYVIPGIPTPWRRPVPSKKSHTIYNAQATQQLIARISLQEQHENKPLFEGPLHVDITFYMPITKSNANQKNKVQPR